MSHKRLNQHPRHDDDDDKNPEDIPTEFLPIGKTSVGISSAHQEEDDDDEGEDEEDDALNLLFHHRGP